MIDGIGILLHVLVSASLVGVSVGLIFIPSKTLELENKILEVFVLIFAFSTVSGITLFAEFALTNKEGLLYSLIHHPLGRSSLLGYVIINFSLLYLWFSKTQNIYFKKTVYLLLFLASILLSAWSLAVNTLMQYPELTFYFTENPNQLFFKTISYLLNQRYVFLRFAHNYIAFIILGLSLVFLVINNYKITNSSKKTYAISISLLVLLANITMLFSGHYQIEQVGKINTHKFTSIVGSENEFRIYFPGAKILQQNKVFGIDVTSLYPVFSYANLKSIPLKYDNNNANEKSIFNLFHLMTLVWSIINLLSLYHLYMLFKSRKISFSSSLIAYLLPMFAIVCGWLVSELGRQPWLFYKSILVADVIYNKHLFKIFNNVVLQLVLLILLHRLILKKRVNTN
jgi:cytochrome bd-type quinol oxidase subunit 1